MPLEVELLQMITSVDHSVVLIWDKILKNGPSKICGRQPLKNFTWSILQFFVLHLTNFVPVFCFVFVISFLQCYRTLETVEISGMWLCSGEIWKLSIYLCFVLISEQWHAIGKQQIYKLVHHGFVFYAKLHQRSIEGNYLPIASKTF